jgi:formylglycine-generating enzyme required for sulfatase activity
MGSDKNPSQSKGDNLPVENVSWDDAQAFIEKLNELHDGYSYRLPREEEWEYACRAATTGEYPADLKEMAWYKDTSPPKTHPVGGRQANNWDLYDMLGNVSEWCEGEFKQGTLIEGRHLALPCR